MSATAKISVAMGREELRLAKTGRVAKSGGTPTTLSSSPTKSSGLPALAVDETSVYWAFNSGAPFQHRLQRVPKTGGPPLDYAPMEYEPVFMLVDSDVLYFTSLNQIGLGSLPIGGGGDAFSENACATSALARDATRLFWTCHFNNVVQYTK